MLLSMTGYGRSAAEITLGKITAEIQSVNRKYLEIYLSLPKELANLEHMIRKWIAQKISRGQISFKINLAYNPKSIQENIPSAKLLKGIKKGWEKLAEEIGLNPDSIDLAFLIQQMPIEQRDRIISEKDQKVLKKCVDEALDAFTKMKQIEGKAIESDFKERIQYIKKCIIQIEKLTPGQAKKYREKITEKMEELFKPTQDLEDRILREIALFAERVDVSEEIVRLKSHIVQFEKLFKGPIVGRKMDFLIQEMGREVNTIGSKSIESQISHLIVEMKSELEKIREQVQNIE